MSPLPVLDKTTPIAIVAAGRLGSSLARALLDAGYNVVAVSSRSQDHREWLSSRMEEVVVTENTQSAANLASVVFVTGPDAMIAEICDSLEWRSHQAVLHCAGVLSVSTLSNAAGQGAAIGGIHPLQTFPSPDSSDRLKETSFAIESDNLNLLDWLKTLVTDLGGSSVEIESRQRPTYHASAVMACGLLAGLVGLAAEMWEPLGIDRDEALKRLIPLVRSTVDSLDQQGLPLAITGPFVRGDVETVKSHLGATDANSGETGRAYAALALASLHIARQQGGITDEDYESIKTLLSPENRQ